MADRKGTSELCLGPGLISKSSLINVKKGSYTQWIIHKWKCVTKNNARTEIVATLSLYFLNELRWSHKKWHHDIAGQITLCDKEMRL